MLVGSLTIGLVEPSGKRLLRQDTPTSDALVEGVAGGIAGVAHFTLDESYNNRPFTINMVAANFVGGSLGAGVTTYTIRRKKWDKFVPSEVVFPAVGITTGEIVTRLLGG